MKHYQERYLDIMQEGTRHFGVKEEYIVSLQRLDKEPRPKPEGFYRTLYGPSPSEAPLTIEEVMKQDGKEGRPLYGACNGEVIQILNPTLERVGNFFHMRKRQQTAIVEDFLPMLLYDPHYGILTYRKRLTKEHSAYKKHLTVQQRLG